MKLSDNTLKILKNFSTINQGLSVRKGSVLKTLDKDDKNLFAVAGIPETFEVEFAVFDLNKILAKLSLYKDADIEFGSDKLIISNSAKTKTDYIKYCSPSVVGAPDDKKRFDFGDTHYSFILTADNIDWMRKSAGISGSEHFVFESDGKSVYFIATSTGDDSSDVSKIKIADSVNGDKFYVVMRTSHFKLIDGDYEVSVNKRGVVKFQNQTLDIVYYAGIESKFSRFED